MRMNAARGLPVRQWLFCACWLALAVASICGCASRAGSAGAGGAEIMTDSDEPELRKRARIRLELALGYFEQGQINIALDELKLSLAADPGYAEAYSMRGLIYMRLGEMQVAEESFRRALGINPRDANVMHNLAWLLCQQARYPQAQQLFAQALANPQYGERAKTLRAQGLCEVRAGKLAEGEQSLFKSYEFDAGNPVTAYNLAQLLFQRGDYARAQFYIRRLNNTELANAESLWLGIKVERQVRDADAMAQLATQLARRFPQSREHNAYQRGAFDE